LAANPKTPIGPADRAVFAKVVPGASYTGAQTDPLTIAVKRHQQLRGGEQDGRISPVQQNITYDWMMLSLSNNASNSIGQMWPRLDLHPSCPAALKAAVMKCVESWVA
jgi:hypothetical protein